MDKITENYKKVDWIEENQYLLVHKGYVNRPDFPEINDNLVQIFKERRPILYTLEPSQDSIKRAKRFSAALKNILVVRKEIKKSENNFQISLKNLKRETIFEIDWDSEGRISVVNSRTKVFTISAPSVDKSEVSVGSLSEILVYLCSDSNTLTILRKGDSVDIDDIALVFKNGSIKDVKWAALEHSNTYGTTPDLF